SRGEREDYQHALANNLAFGCGDSPCVSGQFEPWSQPGWRLIQNAASGSAYASYSLLNPMLPSRRTLTSVGSRQTDPGRLAHVLRQHPRVSLLEARSDLITLNRDFFI